MDEIKRTSGPQTTNGKRWEVQLSDTPSDQWIELFRLSGESSVKMQPQRVEFDRGTAAFKCESEQVEQWIGAIDKWISSTNTRYVIALEQVRRERFDRVAAATKEQERIQGLNDRFKNL